MEFLFKTELEHDSCVGSTGIEHSNMSDSGQLLKQLTTSTFPATQIKQEIVDLYENDIKATRGDVLRNKQPTNASICIEIPEEDDDILEITTVQNMIELLNISTPSRKYNKVEKKTRGKEKSAKLQQATKKSRTKTSKAQKKLKKRASRSAKSAITPSDLCLSIIDLPQPYGRILRENEGVLEDILKTTFLLKILYDNNNSGITPRYDDIYWYCGRLNITCMDEASRDYLKEFVSNIAPLWPGCHLVAMNYLDFYKMKRIELYTNKFIPSNNEFLSVIERQNPKLDETMKIKSRG